MDGVCCKINFMPAISFLQCQHKKEIMPVKIMYEVTSMKYLLDGTNAKIARSMLFFLWKGDMSYRYCFQLQLLAAILVFQEQKNVPYGQD